MISELKRLQALHVAFSSSGNKDRLLCLYSLRKYSWSKMVLISCDKRILFIFWFCIFTFLSSMQWKTLEADCKIASWTLCLPTVINCVEVIMHLMISHYIGQQTSIWSIFKPVKFLSDAKKIGWAPFNKRCAGRSIFWSKIYMYIQGKFVFYTQQKSCKF